MNRLHFVFPKKTSLSSHILYLINAYLLATTVEYLLLPAELGDLSQFSTIAALSLGRMFLVMALLYVVQWLLSAKIWFEKTVRWITVSTFAVYAVATLVFTFTLAYFVICLLIVAFLTVFAMKGWNQDREVGVSQPKSRKWSIITVGSAIVFFCLVSGWTVARVRAFWTPSFDFGIFAQMFHYMKTTGLPFTTLERDGLLSHFAVHVSPIYYLMLPFYCIFPRPETLQVLQAAVVTSSVIPLWKLGKKHGLHPGLRCGVCVLLLVYPAFAGGTSYDIHENCFLTPLLLWLFYGMDSKKISITAIFAVLSLMVKEDAAVYVAVAALYLLLRSLLYKQQRGIAVGGGLLAFALCYFLGVTTYLANAGDGVMNSRYQNFMYDGSDSLLTVVKAVLLCPAKAIFECVDTEKLQFIALTMLPLLGLPLFTRRYERLVLLIPYLLVNLMSDYTYQHDIMFQYTFGSTACLFYLVVVNLADIQDGKRTATVAVALCIGFGCFCANIIPVAWQSISVSWQYQDSYDCQRQFLDAIDKDATVAATTFYTTYLSDRAVLYDVQYTSPEHILECEYVVIAWNADFRSYEGGGWYDREGFITFLTNNGYALEDQIPEVMQLYKRT